MARRKAVSKAERERRRRRRAWLRREPLDDDEARYSARYGYGSNAPWFIGSFAAGAAILLVCALIFGAARLATWLFHLAFHP